MKRLKKECMGLKEECLKQQELMKEYQEQLGVLWKMYNVQVEEDDQGNM